MSAVPQQENPFQGFFQNVGNFINAARNGAGNLVQQVQNNPQVQQVENSPIGLAVQGKFNQVIPAVQKEFSAHPTIAGKPYNPQLAVGGEMKEVPGAGFDPATELPKTGMNTPQATAIKPPGKTITRIKLPASVYGAAREAQVQNTVDHYVPGSTAEEQYKNLQPAMDSFGKQIQGVMKSQPKQASIDTIMANYDKNLNDQGIYRTTNTPRNVIQKAAQSYVRDLYNTASRASNEVVPTNISDQDLYGFKQSINQDAKSVYKKIENGTTLTDKDRVILAAQKTVDDSLTQLHPEVKDLTTKQSHLYDAADSLEQGRAVERKAADAEPGAFQKFFDNPAVKIAAPVALGALGFEGGNIAKAVGDVAGPLLAGGASAVKGIADKFAGSTNSNNNENPFGTHTQQATNQPNSEISNNSTHSSSIPYTPNDVKSDQNGYYHAAVQSQPSAKYESLAEFQQKTAGMSPTSSEYTVLKTEFDNKQALAKQALEGDKASFVPDAENQYIPAGNVIKDDFAKLPPNFLNQFKSYNDVQKYISSGGQYSAELADINQFNTMYKTAFQQVTGQKQSPGDDQLLNAGDSSQAAFAKWTKMMKFLVSSHGTLLEAANSLRSGTGAQDTNGQIQAAGAAVPPAPHSGTMAPDMLQ